MSTSKTSSTFRSVPCNKGYDCKRGSRCQFYHPPEWFKQFETEEKKEGKAPSARRHCAYFKLGQCDHGDKCRYLHDNNNEPNTQTGNGPTTGVIKAKALAQIVPILKRNVPVDSITIKVAFSVIQGVYLVDGSYIPLICNLPSDFQSKVLSKILQDERPNEQKNKTDHAETNKLALNEHTFENIMGDLFGQMSHSDFKQVFGMFSSVNGTNTSSNFMDFLNRYAVSRDESAELSVGLNSKLHEIEFPQNQVVTFDLGSISGVASSGIHLEPVHDAKASSSTLDIIKESRLLSSSIVLQSMYLENILERDPNKDLKIALILNQSLDDQLLNLLFSKF